MTRTAFTAQWQKISPALSRVGSILASQGPRILYLKLLNRWRRVDYRRMFAASLQDSSLPTAGEEKELAGTFASSGASASAGTSASAGAALNPSHHLHNPCFSQSSCLSTTPSPTI